jgi:hypothetical protein
MKKFILLLLFAQSIAESHAQFRSRKVQLETITVNEEFPTTYRERTFIKGLAGFVNNIDQLVGSLILIDPQNKSSVLTRFVKQGKPPIVTASTSDVIYNSKIDNRFKANGSYAIASASVKENSVYEVVITDIGVAFLPEDYIPYLDICKASTKVTPEVKKQMFYVRSAKLTTVFTRGFRKNEKSAIVSGTVFCLGGEVYSSADQFKVDYIISVDLVSLENLLSLQNCNDLINNEELKLRSAEQAAALERTKAEEARKARENELNALKAELENLKKIFASNSDNSKVLQKQLEEAQKDISKAREALQKAEEKAKAMETSAQTAKTKSLDGEKLIITVKNPQGKDNVLEIKNLDELGKEKLKALGFDVDALPKGK